MEEVEDWSRGEEALRVNLELGNGHTFYWLDTGLAGWGYCWYGAVVFSQYLSIFVFAENSSSNDYVIKDYYYSTLCFYSSVILVG